MERLFNAFIEIECASHCCTKKAIKMNFRHESGRPFSNINYYFIFLYHYMLTFSSAFIIIVSNSIPYTLLYLTLSYLPLWLIVYISNTITLTLLISCFFLFIKFIKDVKCKCPELN